MTRLAWFGGAAVAVFAVVWLTMSQPLLGGGLVFAAIVVGVAALIPAEKLVAVAGTASLLMFLAFPVHLVGSLVRYAELVTVALLAIVVLVRRPGMQSRHAAQLLMAGYLAVTVYASLALSIGDSVFQVLSTHAVIALAFLTFGAKSTREDRVVIVKWLIGASLALVAYGLVEIVVNPPVLWASPVPESFALQDDRLPSELIDGLARAQGTFGHPLLYALTLTVTLAVAREYPFRRRGARTLTTALLFAGVMASGSRSATLIAVAVILFTIGAHRFRVIRGIGVALVLVALGAVTGFFGSGVVDRFVTSGSLTHREGVLDSLPTLLAQPFEQVVFGHGWIRAEDVYDMGLLVSATGFKAIDNQLIATFITSGFVGLVALVALFAVVLVQSRGGTRYGLLAIVGLFFVFDVLEFPATWALTALLIGFATTRDRGVLSPPVAPDLPAARAVPGVVRFPARAR